MIALHDVVTGASVTFTPLAPSPGAVGRTLCKLADLGIAIALDDFGTGFSSMAHLRRLPVDEVKIDRSFTGRIARDSNDHAVVRSIIDLGHDLGLRVVAEGVEDKQTRELLAQAGCDIGQGWLIGRPMPADEFVGWLQDHGHTPGRPVLAVAATGPHP